VTILIENSKLKQEEIISAAMAAVQAKADAVIATEADAEAVAAKAAATQILTDLTDASTELGIVIATTDDHDHRVNNYDYRSRLNDDTNTHVAPPQ